jgi:hypothetical protein
MPPCKGAAFRPLILKKKWDNCKEKRKNSEKKEIRG